MGNIFLFPLFKENCKHVPLGLQKATITQVKTYLSVPASKGNISEALGIELKASYIVGNKNVPIPLKESDVQLF